MASHPTLEKGPKYMTHHRYVASRPLLPAILQSVYVLMPGIVAG